MNNDLFIVSHKHKKHSSVMVRVADCIADELMDQHWRIKGVRAKNAHAVFWGKNLAQYRLATPWGWRHPPSIHGKSWIRH